MFNFQAFIPRSIDKKLIIMEKKISDLRIAIKIGHLVETVESIFGDDNS